MQKQSSLSRVGTETLCALFDKYACDKGSQKHRYDRVYAPSLEKYRALPFVMLEIGVFKGNSLEAWVDYFPNATFIGLDVFTRVDPTKIPILQHPRVRWFKCDSVKGPSKELLAFLQGRQVDVIIDDGLHTHDAQRLTFENFFPLLKNDGVYFIEDVWPFAMMTRSQKRHRWLQKHPLDWTDEKYQQLLKSIASHDKKFHDLRTGHDPDSFVIEVKKKTSG